MESIIYEKDDELEDENVKFIMTYFNVEVSFITKQIKLTSTIYTDKNNPYIIDNLKSSCDHYHRCNNQCLVCGETVSNISDDHIDYTPEQLFTLVFDNHTYYNNDIYHIIQKHQSIFKLRKLIKEAINNEKNNQDNIQILNKIEKLIKQLQ